MLSKIADFFRDPRVAIPSATAVGATAVAGGTWFATRSWMIAIAVALAIALVVLIIILLRTLGSEEREERLAGGLEEPREKSAGAHATTGSSGAGIRAIFSQALAEIRRSRLGSDGLHSLPWWITLGPTSSGKTELIRNAGLDAPAEFAHTMRSGPTASCNFVLTNQAIAIDTAGSFVDAGDEAPEDWTTLLRLLKKHRSNGPLEGILVTLSAVSLLSNDAGKTEETARSLRRRLNELTDTLGFDVPIYVVITHLDRLQGFGELLSVLPAERRREAFGWTNDRRTVPDVAEAAEGAMLPVLDQLDQILPELLMRETDPARRRNLFLLPQELNALCRRTGDALRSAFAPSVYDEVPFLRGLYFASATRGGPAISTVGHRLGHDWASTVASPDTAGGVFISGLISDIMIGDDELAVETGGVGRRTRRVVLGIAAAASVAALALAGVSFGGNYFAIRDLEKKAQRLMDAPSSLDAADALRDSIIASSSSEVALAVPFMGRPRDKAIDQAKSAYLWALEREHIRPTKQRIKGILRQADHDAFEALAVLALDVSWLADAAEGDATYRPDLVQYTDFDRNDRDREAFVTGYDAYVRWSEESTIKTTIKDERDAVLESATRLLDLRRLEEWSERSQDRQPPISHGSLGLNTAGLTELPTVAGAYSRQGWESLIRDLVKAVEDSGGTADANIQRFRSGYVSRFDRSWEAFLLATPTDPTPNTAVFDSPHLAIFERIASEVEADLPRENRRPEWMNIAIGFRQELAPAAASPPAEGAPPPPPTPWSRYKQALDQVALDADIARTQTSDKALQAATKIGQGSSFTNALALLEELIPPRTDTPPTRKLREILSMPILDAGAAVLEASLPELNRVWYQNIYKPYAIDGRNIVALYNPQTGPLAGFLQNDLGPFFERDAPKKLVGDLSLPLDPGFLGWLESARSLQRTLYPGAGSVAEIPVRLRGTPANVVGQPDLYVTRRDLELECASSVQTYEYRNGMSTERFSWKPDCQTLSLKIWVSSSGGNPRELQPRKEWTGPLALPKFLQQGARAGNDLYQWNLRYDDAEVQVEYEVRSGAALFGMVHRAPPAALKGQPNAN